ncbi:hypothetical protein LEP1GSC062_2241 [Leptospira alexanderi serovar Manhao 3 str. L 60]|uniref:Uncharacterized protein n=1 Tax=Leptospira alexanderi serovar Manhao 3 str. L 60 TaxID=1049759 RepID=V6IA67_9LEPT|nr:hypothetical protein LEP1GSC062_2241 [Leptospira alexanderi serovar Manhao 3 str. L 60]
MSLFQKLEYGHFSKKANNSGLDVTLEDLCLLAKLSANFWCHFHAFEW